MARLLFVNHTGRLGGPSHSLLKLLKYLRVDHEPTVVMPQDGEFVSVLRRAGIPCHARPLRHRYIPALALWIWRGNYDLVYGNNFSNAAYRMLVAAKLVRKPFVWHIREVFKEDSRRRSYRRVRHADAVIAVSQAGARSVKRYVPRKDVTVVYNGVEVEDFSVSRSKARSYVCKELGISGEEILVTSVGAVCSRKNQLHAVEAAAEIVREYPSVKFCFLGRLQEPEYVGRLKEQATQFGIRDSVFLPGFRDDVAMFLRGSDILLHTPSWDPHPRSVLEGMAAELPVVAYDVDGVSETVIPDRTGYLVPFGDVTGVSRAIQELVASPALREQMGARGKERVVTVFTAERTVRQVVAVIDSVLQR